MKKYDSDKSLLVERLKQQSVTIHQLTHHLHLLQARLRDEDDTCAGGENSRAENLTEYISNISKSFNDHSPS